MLLKEMASLYAQSHALFGKCTNMKVAVMIFAVEYQWPNMGT